MLHDIHHAYGQPADRTPNRFLGLASTRLLIDALGPDADRELDLAYAAWLDPEFFARLLRESDTALDDIQPKAARQTRGRLAGIENLQVGQSLQVPTDRLQEMSLRTAVSQMSRKLGRRFSVRLLRDIATVTRVSDVAARPVVRPARPAVPPMRPAAPARPVAPPPTWPDPPATDDDGPLF